MFISPKQVGQVLATLSVGGAATILAKVSTTKLYQLYYVSRHTTAYDNSGKLTKQATEDLKTANKALSVVSTVMSVAVGACFANYMGWISLSSLASRFSTRAPSIPEEPTTPIAETTEKVKSLLKTKF